MADINSIITGKLNGLLGKELVFREWGGKTIVAKAPRKRKTAPSPEQEELQEKFLLASRYAKAVVKATDQSMAQGYATVLRPRQNVYSRALEDFLSSPKVKRINTSNYHGTVNDKILVRAVDDFRVVDVRVEIYAPNGTLLEKESADMHSNGLDWTYSVQQANNLLPGTKIKAIATDVPGNEGTLEVTL